MAVNSGYRSLAHKFESICAGCARCAGKEETTFKICMCPNGSVCLQEHQSQPIQLRLSPEDTSDAIDGTSKLFGELPRQP